MAGLSRLGIRPFSGATFEANFRARTILARGAAGVLDGATTPDELFTCVRIGAARTIDFGAVAAVAPPNALRYAHHPVAQGARGLAIERGGTNLLLQSNGFDTPTWSKSNLTIAANATAALDGSQTAEILTETSTATPGVLTQNVVVPTVYGAPLLWSAYVRPLTGATNLNLTVALSGGSAVNGVATFDLVNGTVVGYTGPVGAFIEPGPRGLWRIGLLINNTNNTLLVVGIGRAVAGDPPASFVITDAAVDTQSRFPLAPNPTTAAIASRNPDDVRLPMANQGWLNPGLGTFVIEADLFGDPAATTTLLAIRNTDAEYLRIYRDGNSNAIVCAMVTAAGGSALTVYGVDTLPARLRIAYSYAPGDFRVAMTGGKADAVDAGIIQAFSGSIASGLGAGTLFLGSFNGGSYLDGCIGRVAYRPSSTSAADISDLVR